MWRSPYSPDVSPHLIEGAVIRPNEDRTADPEGLGPLPPWPLQPESPYSIGHSDGDSSLSAMRPTKNPGYALAHSRALPTRIC